MKLVNSKNFLRFTIYTIIIALVFSSLETRNERKINKLKNKEPVNVDQYKVMLLGDMGQVEFFYKKQFKTKNAEKPVVEEWYKKNLLAEELRIDNVGCIVKNNEGTFDLVTKDGLENFDKIIANTEFRKIMGKTNSFGILGDMIYPETKYLTYKNNDGTFTQPNKPQWVKRLKCAWNLFARSLEKAGLVKVRGSNIDITTDVELLAGNHSFDIDVNEEENILLGYKRIDSMQNRGFEKREILLGSPIDVTEGENKSDTTKGNIKIPKIVEEAPHKVLTEYPKFIQISFKKFKIEFIDFNSGGILCLNAKNDTDYKKCNKFNVSFLPYSQAIKYFIRLYDGIERRFTESTNTLQVWRAMRAHHPPVNSEDGDSEFYFNDIQFAGDSKIYNLISLMKKKRVNIFFGSHIHNAQVAIYPYGRKLAKLPDDFKENSVGFGCVEAPNSKFEAKPVHKVGCTKEISYNLPISDTAALDQTLLYIFVNGHSGRNFDPLKTGKLTNGYVVWSRAIKNEQNNEHYGFSTATFSEKSVNIEYFELNPDKNLLSKVSNFNIEKGNFVDYKKINSVIDSIFGKK